MVILVALCTSIWQNCLGTTGRCCFGKKNSDLDVFLGKERLGILVNVNLFQQLTLSKLFVHMWLLLGKKGKKGEWVMRQLDIRQDKVINGEGKVVPRE